MKEPLVESLKRQGVSRRTFNSYCATLASLMALPPTAGRAMAQALTAAAPAKTRPSVIWLPFQECTGCTESITRSHSPTLESLIFDAISLDYQETLMAAAGHQAEEALHQAMKDNAGKYLLIVDGSIPLGLDGAYSCIGGKSNLETLKEVAKGAMAVIAMGSCSSFGGLPKAHPNPTGAVSVGDVIKDKPVINIPGCPPIPVVMTGVLAHFLTFGTLPELDSKNRPKAFYGETIHDRCYRRPFYDQGKFAKTFDDEGARNGWCLFELGCKGPVTYNSCATTKWNAGTSWPVESGHGCLGCSEPDFWDAGSFYSALAAPAGSLQKVGAAAVAGLALGALGTALNRSKKSAAKAAHETTTLADLEKQK